MSAIQVSTQDDVRRHNLAKLIRRMHVNGPASRSELVAQTGLNRSTVGALVSELAEAGLVVEEAGSTRGVGRPSLVVAPVPESVVVVAFDLRVERTVGALVGLGGTVFARKAVPHRRSGFTARSAVPHLIRLTRDLLAQAPPGTFWLGTGVAVPGVVNHADGLVRFAPNLGWVDAPFGELLERGLGDAFGESPPVVIGNDADLGAIAEHVRGAATGADNVIYLSGEIGIGGGVVLAGRPLGGAGGYGGEVGHMVVNPTGELCHCGARGCWETEIGRDAVLRAAGRGPDSGDVIDIVRSAQEGDPRAVEGLRHVGEWLGLGLANLVNLFNPEVIVLGGQLRDLLPLVRETVTERMGQALPALLAQARVAEPALGGDSSLMGAAETVFESLLVDPIGTLANHAVGVAV